MEANVDYRKHNPTPIMTDGTTGQVKKNLIFITIVRDNFSYCFKSKN